MQFPIPGLPFQHAGVLILIALGALFGVFAATLAGSAVPNSRLRQFADEIEQGRILLMVDVPHQRVTEVQQLLGQRHPEAAWRGVEPTVPAFP